MTKGGYAFIAAGLVVYIVASQTQVGWLYLFDAIIWSLLYISIFLPGQILKTLKVEQQVILPSARGPSFSGGPIEDEPVDIRLVVSNSGRLARYFVALTAELPFEQEENSKKSFLLLAVNPGKPVVFSLTTTCYHRGYYATSNVTLRSSGLMGLVVRRRSFQLPLKITVYPRYYRMEGLPSAGDEMADRGQGVKAGSASEFYGSRDYQYGDPFKHVHWRNTARTGQLMIKEFEQTFQGGVVVAFDTSRDFGQGRETTLEYSIKIAASVARLCAESGRGIDIIAGGTNLHNVDWGTAMDFMARLEVDSTPFQSLRTLPDNQAVVILTEAPTQQMKKLAQLASRGRGVVIVLEGFAPDGKPEKAAVSIAKNSLEIRCSPGDLEKTISELSTVLFAGGKYAR